MTESVLLAVVVGVPLKRPVLESVIPPGTLVALHVIGVVPVAVNWYEYAMPTVPPGMGDTLLIVGATPGTVSEKFVGPACPVAFVAVIASVETATALGVPVSNPELESEAQAGSPVPVQVIGAAPLAENWKEYATPNVALGNGLLLVIVGGIGGATTVIEKLCGPLFPVAFVAVTAITVVPLAFGVPVRAPPLESEAQPGRPVAPQVIGVVPLAVN